MFRRIILSCLVLMLGTALIAQTYNTAGGLRFGTDWGITLKQRIAKKITLEGILQSSSSKNRNAVALLAEFHAPLFTKRFNLYAGAGIQKGWYTAEEILFEDPFGIAVIGGGEFTIGRLNLSYDVKPVFNLSGGSKNLEFETAVSARYVIVKKKWKPFKKKRKSKRKKRRDKHWWKFWEKS